MQRGATTGTPRDVDAQQDAHPVGSRVEHEGETDLAAQLLAAKLQEGLGHCVKQQFQQGALVALLVSLAVTQENVGQFAVRTLCRCRAGGNLLGEGPVGKRSEFPPASCCRC